MSKCIYIVALLIGVVVPQIVANTLNRNYERNEAKETTGPIDEPETTTVFPGPVITTCGGIIEGDSGTIEYTYDSTYTNYAKCVWTIRTSGNSAIELTKLQSYFVPRQHWLSAYLYSITRRGLNQTQWLGYDTQNEEQVVMQGPVVILVFHSDTSGFRRGFRVHFRGVGNPVAVSSYHDFNTGAMPGTLQYPSIGNYSNNELSTFVITRNYTNSGGVALTLSDWNLENDLTCGYDGLIVYQILSGTLRQVGLWCGIPVGPVTYKNSNAFLLVLYSDQSNVGTGFEVSWTFAF